MFPPSVEWFAGKWQAGSLEEEQCQEDIRLSSAVRFSIYSRLLWRITGTNPEVFEDLGQSGTTDRPAFQRLMGLIRSKEVRALAVYDVSRVTRAISDWADFLTEIQVSGTVLYTKEGVSDSVKLN